MQGNSDLNDQGEGLAMKARSYSSDNGLVLPDAPGTYALLLRCASCRRVSIGRLGVLQLRPGWYVYVGSAFATGGLRARFSHHQRVAQRPHWHVDYLRRRAQLVAVWYVCGERCEHKWAESLGAMPDATIPMAGFGSSDCGCPTHLFQFGNRPPAGAIRVGLGFHSFLHTAEPDRGGVN
jgi:Uri superfamily endonuclease